MSFPKIIPWFMFIIDLKLLITSPISPTEIKDTKNILFAETNIPGSDYAPVSAGGFGNRKINFSMQIIRRNDIDGNSNIIKLYETLRTPATSIANVFNAGSQFVQNPKVIYNYGIGSVPLVWYVTKIDFTHQGQYTNAIGNPKFTSVDIELTLDETDITNKIEKTFRQFASIIGSSQANLQTTFDYLNLRAF